MDKRREELRKAVRRAPPARETRRGRTTGPPQKQSYPKPDKRFVPDRREELVQTLGVRNLKPGERADLLHKGKVVGPPWLGGIFQTRLNIGTFVLILGVVLFVVWLIMRAQEGG